MLDGSISHIPRADLPPFPIVNPPRGAGTSTKPPSSPTLVVLESPASPKGAIFTPSSSVKAGSASVATKENVKSKGSVFTRLSPVVDALVDAPFAAAPSVEVSYVVPPPVDAPELDAPTVPSESCVAQDAQPCSRPQQQV
ncbi:hypothetical protein NC651_016249 [Populus alba x Populus x berolinensis]|nr:hypothetical protein NC651_016249 [Populus alba x Populus x berolinensis]